VSEKMSRYIFFSNWLLEGCILILYRLYLSAYWLFRLAVSEKLEQHNGQNRNSAKVIFLYLIIQQPETGD